MNKFIKLHSMDTNLVSIINVDNIISIVKNDDGSTEVCLDDEDVESIFIKESPEKIFQILTDMGFANEYIKVHTELSNSLLIIKKKYILIVIKEDDSTNIYYNVSFVDSVSVNESPERVYNLMMTK